MNSSAGTPDKTALAQNLTGIEKAGEILFRLRDYTPIPIVLAAILFAMPTVESFVLGLFVALVGEFVRTYGVAFIGTISRTRSYSNGELVKTGPFSLLRNPLYFGNLLLSLGLSIIPNVSWLPAFVFVIFYVQYIPIVTWEEMKLRRIFGEAYEQYCREVPNRWFPSLAKIFKDGWYVAPKDWQPALKSEKRTLTSLVSFTVVMGIIFWAQTNGKLVGNIISQWTPF